jgi:hypothetical protein
MVDNIKKKFQPPARYRGFPDVVGFGEGCLLHDLGRGRLSDPPTAIDTVIRRKPRRARLVQIRRITVSIAVDQRV